MEGLKVSQYPVFTIYAEKICIEGRNTSAIVLCWAVGGDEAKIVEGVGVRNLALITGLLVHPVGACVDE